MKLTITKIYRSTTDKNKKPLVTRDGRSYERISIQAKEYGDQWLSGFGSQLNANWKEGDTVEIEVEKSGQYLNFRALSKIDLLEQRVVELEKKIASLEILTGQSKTQSQHDDISPISDNDLDEGEIDTSQIPF